MTDPYETLGLAPVFELDDALLERRHLELSRALHPDRYAGRPAGERRQALGRAIEVNQAFRKLRDPVGRAEALLARHGKHAGEVGAAPAAPMLLMEVLERREALGEAKRRGDLAAVRALTATVRQQRRAVVEAIAGLFSEDPPDLARVEALLGELRYHVRFLDEADAAEDEMG